MTTATVTAGDTATVEHAANHAEQAALDAIEKHAGAHTVEAMRVTAGRLLALANLAEFFLASAPADVDVPIPYRLVSG